MDDTGVLRALTSLTDTPLRNVDLVASVLYDSDEDALDELVTARMASNEWSEFDKRYPRQT